MPHVELIHSVASDSALRELGRHAPPDFEILVEVNVAASRARPGSRPDELDAFIARSPVAVAGLMTMPPLAARSARHSRAALRGARARSRASAACDRALDGHEPGFRGRRRGGRDDRADRHDHPRRAGPSATVRVAGNRPEPAKHQAMPLRDSWHRTLVYFGLAEEPDEYDVRRPARRARGRARGPLPRAPERAPPAGSPPPRRVRRHLRRGGRGARRPRASPSRCAR